MSLKDYIGRMKDGQEKIYYVTADSFNAAKNSPHLEVFRKKGIEVLLLSDRVDEWVVSNLPEFEGKQLVSVAKGGLDLGALEDEAEKKEQEKQADEFKGLTDKIKTSLGGRVKEVRVTHRLTDSPGLSGGGRARHERQPRAPAQGLRPEGAELAAHPRDQPRASGGVAPARTRKQRFDDWAAVLFDQALLAEGGQLDDPAGFVKRINQLMLEMGK